LIAELKKKNELSYIAAQVLGAFKDPRAVKPLIGAVKNDHNDMTLRHCAIEALGEIQDPRAIKPLMNALKNYKGWDTDFKVAVNDALKKIQENK
jgi:HEAT repeat protein